jgi:cell division protein FtsW (lipid II flippase)
MQCLLIGMVLVEIINHGNGTEYNKKKKELNKHQARSAWLGLWIMLWTVHQLVPFASYKLPSFVWLYLFITVVLVEVRSHGNGTEYTKGNKQQVTWLRL